MYAIIVQNKFRRITPQLWGNHVLLYKVLLEMNQPKI